MAWRKSLVKYERMLKVPYGMILVSGPTGAGKTTTLYASINSVDSTRQKIITIEDPVEYRFQNISQVQINPRAGVTFSAGLRSILRLDPDVILVGEIRDGETAKIAVQFDYWEVRQNELLHHHGLLSDLRRYPTEGLQIEKEINDVFEFMLLRSGKLILRPQGNNRDLVLENIVFIDNKEKELTKLLGARQVEIRT